MRLLGLDLETTGFDTANDRITELGAVLWDVESKQPLDIFSCFVYDETLKEKFTPETVAMMERVCGITPGMLEEFGVPPVVAFGTLEEICRDHKVDYIVAHNGENYDKPLLFSELKRHGVSAPILTSLPWMDTRSDIPFPTEPDSRKLKHLAGDHGFLNPFSHRAVFDVLTMLRVLSHYDIKHVLEYQSIPWVVVRAMVSYDDREKAKAQRYSWEKIGDEYFQKSWVKKVKANMLDQEIETCKKAGFRSVRIK